MLPKHFHTSARLSKLSHYFTKDISALLYQWHHLYNFDQSSTSGCLSSIILTSFIFMAESDGVRARRPGLHISALDTTIPGWTPSAFEERLGGPYIANYNIVGIVSLGACRQTMNPLSLKLSNCLTIISFATSTSVMATFGAAPT